MSLLGALSLGGSSLAAQQTGLQVTGNNIANAGTEGYSRQTVALAPGTAEQIANGQYLGTGVNVQAVNRQANAAINQSLRDATSDKNSAQTLSDLLGRIEDTFGALNDSDLSARMSSFFNSFSTLSTNPGDQAQRSVVVQSGASLANYLQDLRGQLTTIQADAGNQINATVTQANTLAQTIANINSQIAQVPNGQAANSLLDQRDQALMQLSQLMDIKVIDQGGANLNVLVGSVPLVNGTTTRGVTTAPVADNSTNPPTVTTKVVFADNHDVMNVSGGKLGSLMNARNNYVVPAVNTVNTIAGGLIQAVNSIHSQGQGLSGFSTVTGTNAVIDPTAALNGSQLTTGLAFAPKNGTFNLYIQDTVSGQITTKQINVNLTGTGTQTSLNSLAAGITAAGGGVVSGSVDSAGHLVIASNNNNVTFGFGEDTSGTLASLGINTFFTGSDATNIAVNSVLTDDSSKLAAGRGNVPGSNTNAQALALAGSAAVSQLSGKSLTDYYSDFIGNLSAHAKNAADDVTAQNAIHDTMFAQQQAISGVSLDEEAINLTRYQRAFQGTARFITVVDEMMQTVLGLIR